MSRLFAFVYGTVSYVIFFATFLYLIGFVSGWVVPKSASHGGDALSLGVAIAINVGLIAVFAIQHTIMARPAFKKAWTKIIPEHLERSTFVLTTCAVFALMFTQWQPLGDTVWQVSSVSATLALDILAVAGWGLVLLSTFMIDHFDLFGLRQSLSHAFGAQYRAPQFRENLIYSTIRHPLMAGFLIAFWAAPHMTVGRLVFAATYTVYVLLAIRIEERDLIGEHGEAYLEYRRRVPALLPLPRPRAARTLVESA